MVVAITRCVDGTGRIGSEYIIDREAAPLLKPSPIQGPLSRVIVFLYVLTRKFPMKMVTFHQGGTG